jgi:SAM-dependent methyltransferase
MSGLILTGERTVPGLAQENYWFRRHEVAYAWLIERFDLAGGILVDAGSGEGYGAAMLRRAGAAQVIALEVDEQAAAHSRRQYPEVGTVRANLDALPFADACVDAVVTMQVIEHLWDLRGFLRHCRRILRPGGTIVAATPNRPTFSPGLGRGERPTNPFHVEEFDADQVAGLLTEAGFSDIDIYGVHHRPDVPADLVQQQVRAALADHWPPDLLDRVAAITIDDFAVTQEPAGSLDLIGVGRVADRS